MCPPKFKSLFFIPFDDKDAGDSSMSLSVGDGRTGSSLAHQTGNFSICLGMRSIESYRYIPRWWYQHLRLSVTFSPSVLPGTRIRSGRWEIEENRWMRKENHTSPTHGQGNQQVKLNMALLLFVRCCGDSLLNFDVLEPGYRTIHSPLFWKTRWLCWFNKYHERIDYGHPFGP